MTRVEQGWTGKDLTGVSRHRKNKPDSRYFFRIPYTPIPFWNHPKGRRPLRFPVSCRTLLDCLWATTLAPPSATKHQTNINMKLICNLFVVAMIVATSTSQTQAGDRGRGDFNKDHSKGKCGDRGLSVVGLTANQRLLTFDEYAPQRLKSTKPVSGLIGGDTALIGIDYRVQDGRLYGVRNAGGVYVIDVKSAVATLVNRLSVALSGTSFGVDFNPAADRLRIISDSGQNLRHNVNAGGVTLVDMDMNYTPGTPAAAVTGAAYTNNDLDPNTATTLFDIDSSLDQVVLQSPPNNGSLAATGKLLVDTNLAVGFDIHSTLRGGSTVEVEALASLSSPTGAASLYSINLLSGKVTWRGIFKSSDQVIDIAIPLDQR